MEWLAQNRIWLAVGVGAVMMLRRGGQGGHGGCCGGGGHGGGGKGSLPAETTPRNGTGRHAPGHQHH